MLKEWVHDTILRFVMASVDKEGRDGDLGDITDDGPRFERTRDMELGRALPVSRCSPPSVSRSNNSIHNKGRAKDGRRTTHIVMYTAGFSFIPAKLATR